VRDIPPIALGTFGGAAVVTYSLAVASGALRPPDLPIWANVLLAIGAATVGLFFGGFLIFLWNLRPSAWKRHWSIIPQAVHQGRGSVGPYSWKPAHTSFTLASRHFHRVGGLCCVVSDPQGREWTAPWPTREHLMQPSEGLGCDYPPSFTLMADQTVPAPWPAPGHYKLRWEIEVPARKRRLRLAETDWVVE
jgi:hypothetical protein